MKKLLLIMLLCTSFAYGENIKKFASPIKKVYISSPQGGREKIIKNGEEIAKGFYHNAVDFACPDKTKVYATKKGIAVEVWPSYYNGGANYPGHPVYGGLIELKHEDGTRSRYAHLSFTGIKEGEEVEQGVEIGWSGGVYGRRGSGNSTGPHLHFEIILDIEQWIEKHSSILVNKQEENIDKN